MWGSACLFSAVSRARLDQAACTCNCENTYLIHPIWTQKSRKLKSKATSLAHHLLSCSIKWSEWVDIDANLLVRRRAVKFYLKDTTERLIQLYRLHVLDPFARTLDAEVPDRSQYLIWKLYLGCGAWRAAEERFIWTDRKVSGRFLWPPKTQMIQKRGNRFLTCLCFDVDMASCPLDLTLGILMGRVDWPRTLIDFANESSISYSNIWCLVLLFDVCGFWSWVFIEA
jgi:hypothetical protein